jgi:hypothetical protein
VNGDHVGVPHATQVRHLPLEARELTLRPVPLQHDLDRALDAEALVPRPVDRAHASFSEDVED